jgi:DNA-binding IclR family transcriptional regulator
MLGFLTGNLARCWKGFCCFVIGQATSAMSERLRTNLKDSPLGRYITVLEAVASAQAPLGLSELAAACNLPLGSAHRLVAGLLSTDLLVAEGSTRRTYRFGQRLLRLLHAGTEIEKIRVAVQSTLEGVADRLSETCYLARLSGEQVISIAWAVPERGVRGYVFPGDTMPPNAAASAKAIIAFQPREFIKRILAQTFEKFTPVTKTKAGEIRAEYNEVRKKKFAVCWEELEIGLAAVACPVVLPEVGVIYALGAAGMSERIQRRSINTVVAELQAALPKLERVLLHVSGPPLDPRAPRPRDTAPQDSALKRAQRKQRT